MSIKVRVEVEDYSREVLQKVRGKTIEGLREAGAIIFAASQAAVPVDEGDLKASGKIEIDMQWVSVKLIYGGIGARHAHLIEYGHVTRDGTAVAPHSYMRGPSDRSRPAVNEVMRRKLGEVR